MERGQSAASHGHGVTCSVIAMSHTRITSRLRLTHRSLSHETIVQSEKAVSASTSSYIVTLPVTDTMGVGLLDGSGVGFGSLDGSGVLGGVGLLDGVGSARRRPEGTTTRSAYTRSFTK